MRKLFDALTGIASADRVSFSRKVFGKNPNNGTTKDRLFVEKLRGSLFDLFSQSEKLLHTRAAFCSLRSREFIKRGIADLTHDNLVVVQHGKPESVSFLVMPLDFVTDQRHGQHSTGAGSPRLPQPASQINGLTATLSRKLIIFLIALTSMAFGVCSPAFAVQELDGSNQNQVNTGVSGRGLVTVSLKTTNSNDVIIVCVFGSSTASTSYSIAGAGLSSIAQRGTDQIGPDSNRFACFKAIAAACSASIWMGTQRQSGWPFRRSRREDDCRGCAITQAIFS